jgi:hypothetical protein
MTRFSETSGSDGGENGDEYLLRRFGTQSRRNLSMFQMNMIALIMEVGSASEALLGGVIDSVFATGPKVREFKPGRGDRFLRTIKIRKKNSFRRGSKAVGPMSEDITSKCEQRCFED